MPSAPSCVASRDAAGPEPGAVVAWAGRNHPVAQDWHRMLSDFFASPTGAALTAFIQARRAAGACIYPPEPFRMLALTPLASVKVVILGQDPYHGPDQAEGLAFSVPDGVRVPPSLRNIHKELRRDLGEGGALGGSLRHWADQGVLLLNTCLTVESGQPASHAAQGWEVLTSQMVQACNAKPGRWVFMLWGAHAQAFKAGIDGARHLVLTANHPSPLSASRGSHPFLGCGHFSRANRWLCDQGVEKIDWVAKAAETMA